MSAERELAHVLYEARGREAWGEHWSLKDRWPADERAWRSYPHNPVAEVDLCLAQARAALAWFAGRQAPDSSEPLTSQSRSDGAAEVVGDKSREATKSHPAPNQEGEER